jgi:CubicO group peptidase (beta-lactamase class C family)
MKFSIAKPSMQQGLAAIIGILLMLAAAGVAPESTTIQVDTCIRAEMQKQRIPGLALAVMRDGQVLLAKGYGFANLEHQIPVKPETVFQSGSLGKQFAATAMMMLVEDGKIRLEDKIGRCLPNAPESWTNITVRPLLTHTSGMTDYPKNFDFRRDYSEDELLKQVSAMPLAFSPGEKFAYRMIGIACWNTAEPGRGFNRSSPAMWTIN